MIVQRKLHISLITMLFLALFLVGVRLHGATGNTYLLITCLQEESISQQIVIQPEEIFTLAYRHSVSNSMVYGTFSLTTEGTIKPLTTSFSSYGPGLPMPGDDILTTVNNGIITVHHNEAPRKEIRLWVSPLTDETLTISNQTFALTEHLKEPVLIEIAVHQAHFIAINTDTFF